MTRDRGFESQRGDPGSLPPALMARGYEPSDAPIRKVVLVLAGLLGSILLGMAGVALMFHFFADGGAAREVAAGQPLPRSGPQLLVHSESEGKAIVAETKANLRRGPIPIGEAMRRVAAAGWGGSEPEPAR